MSKWATSILPSAEGVWERERDRRNAPFQPAIGAWTATTQRPRRGWRTPWKRRRKRWRKWRMKRCSWIFQSSWLRCSIPWQSRLLATRRSPWWLHCCCFAVSCSRVAERISERPFECWRSTEPANPWLSCGAANDVWSASLRKTTTMMRTTRSATVRCRTTATEPADGGQRDRHRHHRYRRLRRGDGTEA